MYAAQASSSNLIKFFAGNWLAWPDSERSLYKVLKIEHPSEIENSRQTRMILCLSDRIQAQLCWIISQLGYDEEKKGMEDICSRYCSFRGCLRKPLAHVSSMKFLLGFNKQKGFSFSILCFHSVRTTLSRGLEELSTQSLRSLIKPEHI